MGIFIGETIDRFEITALVKEDALFAVYQGVDRKTAEHVLIAVILPKHHPSESFMGELFEQVDRLTGLDHPNLARILARGQYQDKLYLAYALGPGHFLTDLVQKPLPERQSAAILAQVASGLHYLHQQQTVAGMLAPEHLYLTADGQALILNYGIEPVIRRELVRAVPESILGIGISSPHYSAPEQVRGREATAESDIYALGAVYYTCLTGVKPYESPSLEETAIKKTVKPLPWPEKLPAKISGSSIRFLLKCLSRQPWERYVRAVDAQKALERLSKGKVVSMRLSRAQRSNAPRKSARGGWFALAALVLMLLAGTAYWWFATDRMPGSAAQPTQVSQAQIERTPSPVERVVDDAPTETAPVSDAVPQLDAVPQPTAAIEASPTPEAEEAATPAVDPIANPAEKPVLVGTRLPAHLQVIDPATNVLTVREIARLGPGMWMEQTWLDENTFAAASSAGVFVIKGSFLYRFIETGGWATSVQFSRDGTILAVGMQNGDIQLWDWQAESLIRVLQEHEDRVSALLFSPNLRHLISASYDLHIKVWDFQSGSEVINIPAHQYPVRDIELSEDGRILASGSGDPFVKLWDMSSGRKITEFNHRKAVDAVALSPDGQFVAAGGSDEINQWNISTSQLRVDPIPFDGGILRMYYLSANSLLVQIDDSSLRTVDPDRERYVKSFQSAYVKKTNFESNPAIITRPGVTLSGAVDIERKSVTMSAMAVTSSTQGIDNNFYEDFTQLYFSPNSSHLLATGSRDLTFLWKAADNTIKASIADIPFGRPFSQDSTRYVRFSDTQVTPQKHGAKPVDVKAVKVISVGYGNEVIELVDVPFNSTFDATVAFTHDDTIFVASAGYRLDTWDINSGLESQVRAGNEYGCMVARSRNDDLILSVVTPLGILYEWDETTKTLCSLGQLFNRLATLSPDRSRVAYINANGLLDVIDSLTGESLWKVQAEKVIKEMAFSPDASLLVTGSTDGSLTFWDVQTGQVITTLAGHFGEVHKIVFSPNGKMIATGSLDGTVRIWAVTE